MVCVCVLNAQYEVGHMKLADSIKESTELSSLRYTFLNLLAKHKPALSPSQTTTKMGKIETYNTKSEEITESTRDLNAQYGRYRLW